METGKDSEDFGGLVYCQGMIFNTVQNAKKLHPAGSENTVKAHFEAKIAEIRQQKLSNTANPSVPLGMKNRKTQTILIRFETR